MWFKIEKEEIILAIIAKPNAKKTAFLRVDEQGLHVALHAPAQDGKANKALISYLALIFSVPKTKITLLSGNNNKKKKVALPLTATLKKFVQDPKAFFM